MTLHETYNIVLFTSNKLMLSDSGLFMKVNKYGMNSKRIDCLGFLHCNTWSISKQEERNTPLREPAISLAG
jgi:hypothetical protein